MTALSLANLGIVQPPSIAMQPTRVGLDGPQAFADAMARHTSPAADPADVATGSQQAAAQDPTATGVGQVAQKPPVDTALADRERVRKALGLDGVQTTPTTGDTILGGLQKLRGVFDARQAHLNDIMQAPIANTQGLMAMQMEVAQYTIMVDVSSKMTGKASSSLDTLMKGQ